LNDLFRFRNWPLRARMATLLIVASVVPLALAALIDLREMRMRLRESCAALLTARGDQLVGQLDVFNSGYQSAIGRFAKLPTLADFCRAAPADPGHLGDALRGIMDIQPANNPDVRAVGILDMQGRVILATADALVGTDLSARAPVRRVLGGASALSDVHASEAALDHEPAINYLAPIRDTDGTQVGAAVSWVRASALWDIAKGANELAGPESYAVVLNQQGICIAYTCPADLLFHPTGKLDRATTDALVAEQAYGPGTAALLADVLPFDEQFRGATGPSVSPAVFRGLSTANHKWNYGIGRRMTSAPWTVFYMLPEDSLEAAIASATREHVALAGVIGLLALVLGAAVAALILRPVRSLSRATTALARGDYGARVPPSGSDELGELGATFNTMAAQLQVQDAALRKARDELELRVQERTADLARTTADLEREIAERKRGDERSRAIVDCALDAIITMNHEGVIVAFNPAAERVFGHRASDAIGRLLEELLIPPALRTQHREGLGRYLATGKGPVIDRRIELTALRADGSTVPIELSITRMPGAGPPMFTGFLRDITERKHAEDALRESEESLATTLDSIGDAVIATDLDGCIVRMNPIAEELTGWTIAEGRGRPLAEVFHILNEDTREPVESPVGRVLREGVVVGLANHTALVARGGAERPIADSGAPIRDARGAISGVVLVFRDQTEERRGEAARERSQQLEAQGHRIQEASRLKSEFLANMSHELRTPLNAIIGFAQLLHDDRIKPGRPEYKDSLGDILSSGRHLLQLINDVLDLSKVEAGMMQFRPEPVELSRLIAEVLGILRTSIAEKGLRVESSVEPDLGGIVLDAGRFKQVLYNYLSNALKFTPDGGCVTVRALAEPGGADFRLEITDTGIGIAPEDLPRLFTEFQQLDAGAAKRHAGTGLGLALTKRLVEAQGGSVGARSVPGAGSTFHAVLPRRAQVGAPLVAAASSRTGSTGAVVLVVDDNDRDQALLRRTLEQAGYAVDTASTGAQAVALCRERAYAAITLDLLLPDMTGLDVLAAIHAAGVQHDVPVIVVTVVTEHGAVAGFAVHDLLPKPLDGDALLRSLGRAGLAPPRAGRVLVVDDDDASRHLMAATLARLGYEALCVPGAAAGLAAAASSPPLAVVLDLLMPGMNGFEFLDRFRQIPACRHVPVIVWSVKDLDAADHDRLRASVHAVVAKDGRTSSRLVEELRALLPVALEGPAPGARVPDVPLVGGAS